MNDISTLKDNYKEAMLNLEAMERMSCFCDISSDVSESLYSNFYIAATELIEALFKERGIQRTGLPENLPNRERWSFIDGEWDFDCTNMICANCPYLKQGEHECLIPDHCTTERLNDLANNFSAD